MKQETKLVNEIIEASIAIGIVQAIQFFYEKAKTKDSLTIYTFVNEVEEELRPKACELAKVVEKTNENNKDS